MSDILPDVNFELKTTATTFDMTSSSHASLDHLLSAKLTGKLIYRRNIAMKLLKRTWLALSAALPKRFTVDPKLPEKENKKDKKVKSKELKTDGKESTKESAKESPKGGGDTDTGTKTGGVDSDSANPNPNPNPNPDSDSATSATASTTSSAALANAIAEEARKAEEEMLKRDRERWAGYQSVFPAIVEWCCEAYSAIADISVLNVDINIKSLSELLDKLTYFSRFFRIYLPAKCAKDPGYVKGAYDKMSKVFFAEMSAVHSRLKAYLDGRLQEEEAKRKQYLIGLTTDFTGAARNQHNKASDTLQRLAALGVEATAEDLIEGDINDTKNYIKKETLNEFTNEVNGYIAFELGTKAVSGIHCVELISGVNRFSFAFQGVDIFELIPRFPSLVDLKKQYDESKTKTFNLRNKKV